MTGAGPSLPPGMLTMGRVVQRLLTLGLPMGPMHLLRTRGRHTGLVREVPIVVLRTDGREWLVSPFGDVAWVRNVRSNGEAHLRRGASLDRVHLVEVDDTPKLHLLRTYRQRFTSVPFVRAAFDATGRDPAETFAREAHRHPIFRIDRQPALHDGRRPGGKEPGRSHGRHATP